MPGTSVRAPSVITDGPRRKTLSVPRAGESAQLAIQAALDSFAALGASKKKTLRLPHGIYPVNNIKMPAAGNLGYSNIRIEGLGLGARIVPADNDPKGLWDVGAPLVSHYADKLTGIVFQNIRFDGMKNTYAGRRSLLTLVNDSGTKILGCHFIDSRWEALVVSGGLSSIGCELHDCVATGCGLAATAPFGQNLAGFNINGYQCRMYDCSASNCGWACEIGGTDYRGYRCSFADGPIVFGSNSFGTSDVEFSACNFNAASVGWGNGIGKQGQVRILNCRFTDSSVGPTSGKATNNVVLDGYPFTAAPSLVQGCTFTTTAAGSTQPVRIVEWASLAQTIGMGTNFVGNIFNVPSGKQWMAVSGGPQEACTFTGNTFNTPQNMGVINTHSPLGQALTNFTDNLVFDGTNPAPSGAYLQITALDQPGWPVGNKVFVQ